MKSEYPYPTPRDIPSETSLNRRIKVMYLRRIKAAVFDFQQSRLPKQKNLKNYFTFISTHVKSLIDPRESVYWSNEFRVGDRFRAKQEEEREIIREMLIELQTESNKFLYLRGRSEINPEYMSGDVHYLVKWNGESYDALQHWYGYEGEKYDHNQNQSLEEMTTRLSGESEVGRIQEQLVFVEMEPEDITKMFSTQLTSGV